MMDGNIIVHVFLEHSLQYYYITTAAATTTTIKTVDIMCMLNHCLEWDK